MSFNLRQEADGVTSESGGAKVSFNLRQKADVSLTVVRNQEDDADVRRGIEWRTLGEDGGVPWAGRR